ncbi:hypothetical protein OROHE_022681 [Orobanche hederae]
MEANGGEPDPWEDVFLPVNNNLTDLASWTTDSQMVSCLICVIFEILSSNDDNEVGADDQCVQLNDKLPENCVGDEGKPPKGAIGKGNPKNQASANGNQRKRKKQQNVEEFHANIQPKEIYAHNLGRYNF